MPAASRAHAIAALQRLLAPVMARPSRQVAGGHDVLRCDPQRHRGNRTDLLHAARWGATRPLGRAQFQHRQQQRCEAGDSTRGLRHAVAARAVRKHGRRSARQAVESRIRSRPGLFAIRHGANSLEIRVLFQPQPTYAINSTHLDAASTDVFTGRCNGLAPDRVPYLTRTTHHEAFNGQCFHAHRAVCMQAGGRYAYFSTQPKLAAIVEARGCIDHHR